MNQFPLQFRLMLILLGISTLIWLSIEDKNEVFVLSLAAAICTLIAVYFSFILSNAGKAVIWQFSGIGLLAGAAVIPTALLLMALKTGFHAHPTPDFSSEQVLALLKRWPVWILGGLLLGLGAGLWRFAHLQTNNTSP